MGDYDEAWMEIQETVGNVAMRYKLSEEDVKQILKEVADNYEV